MQHSRTRGVTLIELLVTMIVSSVVMVGLGSLYMGASADFRMAARMREDRYARQGLESELVWRMKVVPPDFLPSQTQLPLVGPSDPGFSITYTDESGALQRRRVLAFDYMVNDVRTRMSGLANPPGLTLQVDGLPGCSVTVPQELPDVPLGTPQRVDVKTAAIFQYQSTVYWVERPIRVPGESFRSLARIGGLAPLLTGMMQTPPVLPLNAPPPLPLAIGIDVFDVNVVDPVFSNACGTPELADQIAKRRVEWRYTQYGAGR